MKPENRDKVALLVPYAHSMAWDGCHKIYLHMDAEQTNKATEWGYEPVPADVDTLVGWYDSAARLCGLQFVYAVRTVPLGTNENEGYDSVIRQFAEEPEPDDDEEEEW